MPCKINYDTSTSLWGSQAPADIPSGFDCDCISGALTPDDAVTLFQRILDSKSVRTHTHGWLLACSISACLRVVARVALAGQ